MLRLVNSLSLPAGFIISVMLHLLLIAPLLAMVMTHSPGSRSLLARFDKEDFREPPEEEKDEELPDLQLGIDESVTSTLTWIGYEEYQEHLAQLSEVEQAAMSEDPAGGAPASPAAAPLPRQETANAEQSVEAEMTAQADPAEAPSGQTPPIAEPMSALPAQSPPATAALPTWIDEHLVPLTGPEGTVGRSQEPSDQKPASSPSTEKVNEETSTSQSWIKGLLTTIQKVAERMQAQPAPQAAPQVTSPATPPTPPAPPNQAPPQNVAAGSGSNQGEQADKESDATSTVEVPLDQIEAGKPLAAAGLELKPRKPQFTDLMLLSIVPDNPVVEIRFNSAGIPAAADIPQTSGDPRVDAFLLDSLYAWKATGKPLGELKEGQTIDVRIRIILNPRSRR